MSAVLSFVNSWKVCERSCFDYIGRGLGTIEGIQGFTQDTMPREMTGAEDNFYLWTFKISGGAVDVQRNTRLECHGGVWTMDAEFMAVCTSDNIAKEVGGTIMGILPANNDDIAGLGRLYATSFPAIERTTRSVVTDQDAGQERVFFEVRIQMRAVFSNME